MWTRRLTNPAGEIGAASIVLTLTAILLLLRPMGPWWIAPFILGVAALALILPRVIEAPGTWYVLALLVTLRIIEDWPLADNHIYLLGYWCLAIGLALGSPNFVASAKHSSRILIGLAFLFAVFWKGLLSPDYLDGRFFQVTFLTDPRFESAVLMFGGLTGEQLTSAREVLRPLPEGAELLDVSPILLPARFTILTYISTWGTMIVEAACAVLFLLPLGSRSEFLRHVLLIIFCVLTYAFAPVAGFGWLLLTMGLAVLGVECTRLRTAYITAWVLVLIYDGVPWTGLFVDWFRLAK